MVATRMTLPVSDSDNLRIENVAITTAKGAIAATHR